jgi:acetylornithine deacetylase
MTVTMIEAGTQHNVIPDRCKFTVDIRTVDTYSHEEILDIIGKNTKSSYSGPSLNLSPSSIPLEHPLVETAKGLYIGTFGSPTLSDQTFIPVPSIKMGPGMSERSHTADEFIYLAEIEQGITIYKKLLSHFLKG